jgi:hypothetical protein
VKCGARKGRIIQVGLIVREIKTCYQESRKTGVSYIKYTNGRINGLVRSWAIHVTEEKIEERTEVIGIRERSYQQLLDDLKERRC